MRQGLGSPYPLARLELEHLTEEVSHLRRCCPPLQIRAPFQAPLDVAPLLETELLSLVVLGQEHHPSEEHVEEHPEAPDVRRRTGFPIQHRLGRHVVGGARDLEELLSWHTAQESSSEAEVYQLQGPVAASDHEVLRIQVPVHEAVRVATENRLQALSQDDGDFIFWHEARSVWGLHASDDVGEEVRTRAELHDQEILFGVVEVLDDLHNVRVIKGDQCLQLLLELRCLGTGPRDLLDGSPSAGAPVQGLVDLAKGALTQAFLEEILRVHLADVPPDEVLPEKVRRGGACERREREGEGRIEA
mmetsp:Transcript_67237/g.148994  ORF Transcript_67237/g.148994 Transcript_67237/m.148994 type:complete len:303 (+) Transcript_67237:758-1666(+)